MGNQKSTVLLFVLIAIILVSPLLCAQGSAQTASEDTTNNEVDVSIATLIMVVLVTALVVSGVIGYAWIIRKK